MKQTKSLMIENISHTFDNKEVLNNINLCLKEGEIMAIVGRSGCGKSTLLNLVAELIDLESGKISNHFNETSILFQDSRLLPWKTVKENIGWGLKIKNVDKSTRNSIAETLASEVGLLKEDLDKYPHELSGGMKQRVAMARSFAIKPDLLLLDEPFSALDIGLKDDLHRLLIDEISQRSLTVLFITHDIMEAVKLADRIVVLGHNPGRQVYMYNSDTPHHKRDNKYQYSTAMSLLEVNAVKNAFKTLPGEEIDCA